MAGGRAPYRSKHGNQFTVCAGQHKHRSKAEARRCDHLRLLEMAGEIDSLQQQPRFNCVVDGRKICAYVADFSYFDLTTGKTVIEDVKGHKTQLYKLKKKLVEALFPGTEIVEVRA
jgi:hypothetical protein